MIEKDYLKKQIDIFFEELTALLAKKPFKEEKLKHLEGYAEKYTRHTLTYFMNTPVEAIFLEYENDVNTLEIISELLLQTGNEITVLQKAAKIIGDVEIVSKDFSFRRKQNKERIEQEIIKMLG
jgi:hypothetical protein